MTDTKISASTDAGALQAGDKLPLARGGADYSVLGSALITATNVVRPVTFNRNGGGTVIATGSGVESFHVNYAGTIVKVVLLGDQSGSASVDIWKKNVALPTSGEKISGTDPAVLSSATFSSKTSFTGWTLAVAAGDVFKINLASVTSLTWLGVEIWIQP